MRGIFSRLAKRMQAIGRNETLTRIVRTLAAYIWAWIALRLFEGLGIQFDPSQTAAVLQGIEIVLGAIIYSVVAIASKKFPWLEYFLVIPTKPIYTKQPLP